MGFQSDNEVLSFASSGSGGMESAVANLTQPGEPALVISCGKFGERWAELCEAYGADPIHHDSGWGEKVEPADLDRLLGETPASSRCSPPCWRPRPGWSTTSAS